LVSFEAGKFELECVGRFNAGDFFCPGVDGGKLGQQTADLYVF
jgi:hypothetical protein